MSALEVCVNAVEYVSRFRLSGSLPGEICVRQELVCVEQGSAIVSLDGESCLVKAGECLFCPPGCYRGIRPQKEAVLVIPAFRCDDATARALARKIFPVEPFYLSTMAREADMEQFGSGQMVKNALEQVLILCLRHGGADCRERVVSADPLQQHAWIVYQVRDYLHGHYAQRITLELLASLYDISVTQLKRIFKEQTGTTIITYLTDYRIDRAKALIREGSMSFTRIAEAVGYDNIYYFSTQFKKQTGMTPTEYSKSIG